MNMRFETCICSQCHYQKMEFGNFHFQKQSVAVDQRLSVIGSILKYSPVKQTVLGVWKRCCICLVSLHLGSVHLFVVSTSWRCILAECMHVLCHFGYAQGYIFPSSTWANALM